MPYKLRKTKIYIIGKSIFEIGFEVFIDFPPFYQKAHVS